jgi:DNA-binding transcriptional LysR family regulator
MLRLEVQGTLARHFLLPNLPGFLAQYPDIEINMSESDRWIDLIREGVDCVLRFGHLPDSDMIARQVVVLERLTCAAPNYFARYGTPIDPGALDGHYMIGIRSLTTGRLRPMEFMVGDTLREVALPVVMSVTGPESYLATARLGLGLVQVPRFHAETDLANGTLIQILPDCPPPSVPVSLLYPRNRQLSPRVRVFIDYVMRAFGRT